MSGVAMGSKSSPTFANLFMEDWESKWVYTYPLAPIIWHRNIDDVFMVWTHGLESTPPLSLPLNCLRWKSISQTQLSKSQRTENCTLHCTQNPQTLTHTGTTNQPTPFIKIKFDRIAN